MSDSDSILLLALDIGASKHAFAYVHGKHHAQGTVRNTPSELRAFLNARTACGHPVRMLVEATGIYFLDVALMAVELGIEVMVINPKAAHNFAKVLQRRSKTDRLDALMLLEFLKRMPFQAWTPPRRALLELRYYGRHLTQLTDDHTRARNRLHALNSTQASPKALKADLERMLRGLEKRIERLRKQALTLIEDDPEATAVYAAVTSIIGVGATSAVSILAEVLVLPRSLRARACVCHAGLDVRIYESGTSVAKAPRISKHGNKYLRRALFMPAMSAARHDPHAYAFKQRLLDRGKRKMQAIVAIMRKMLTAIWAMVQDPKPYDPGKLYCTALEN